MSQLMRLLSLNSRLCGKRLQNAIPTTGVKVSPSQLRLFSEARMSKIQRTAASDMFGLDRGTRTPLQDLLRILNDQVQRYGRVLTRTVEDAISRAEQRGFVGLAETQVLLRATGSFIKDSPPSKRQQLAAKVWELTPKQNLDISHYNTLLHIHLENGVEFDPSDFLQQLSDAGVAPNRVTYQRLVQRYCVMGDIKNAKKIIEFMKAQDLPITDKVFHSLIIGHLKAGDPESARSIPKLMESALMKPSTETFTVLAEGLIEAGDIQGAFEVIADQQLLDEQILRIAKALALKDDQNAVEKILGSLSDSVVNHVSAKNICSELLVAGKLDAAALIFKKTHVRVLRRNDANFLVVTAAKTGARVEDVLRLLEEVKEDTSPNVFVEATRGAITTGNRDVAEEYIAKLSEMGYPIRAHYYLPFLCRCSDEDDVYKELKFMASIEKPSQDLIFDFVIPRVDCGDPERLYNKLVEAGTEPDVAGTVVAYHLIKNERFEDCEKHLQVHQITRVGSLAALLGELVQMEDLPIAIHILECLAKCAHKTTLDVDVVGQFLEKVVHCKNQAIEAVSKTDLPLSKYCFDRLLKAGLKCESLRRNVVDMPGMEESEYVVSAQRVEELETLLDREENTGKDVTFLLKRLLVLYCRERSSEKVEETLRKLPLDSMQGGIISALVEYYCSQSDPDHALSFILRANDRGITLNPNRILGTARALVKQNRLEDAHELMAKFLRASIAQQDARTDISAANLLLEVYNHYGSEKCIETYDHYLRNHVGLRVIGHAVKSTIDKDITKALELVEGIAERYRDVPCRRLLCKRLIEHNMIDEFNATISLLRKFTPESEINSIMLLSYLECGKIEEAKDALLRLRGGFGRRSLMRACTAYFNSGEIDGLEKLLELMEELKVETDVAMLYRIKLLSMENKVDEAMELWTQSQEENIICVPLALQILSELLQRNGRDVPFVVPDVRDVFAPTDSKNPRFEDILQESVDAALEYRVKLKEDNRTLEMRHMQSLIHELVNVNRVKEAFDVIGDLEDVSKFNDRYKVVLKRLLTAAATQGMVEELEAFHESAGRKFGSHALQRAYFVKGNLDEFVSKLENSPLEKVEFYISPDFFVIDSPLAARLETLAHRLASEKRSYARVIDLWYLYIAQSRMEKAAELIEKYPDMVRYMETLRIRPQVKKVFDLGFLNRVAQVMNNSAVRRKVCLCAAAQLLQDGQLDEANKCIDRGIELGFELNQFPSRIMKALGREAPDAAYKNTNEHEADEEEQRAQSA